MSIEALKGQIKNIHDPRRTSYGNVRHKLEDMIVIGLYQKLLQYQIKNAIL